jgi:hypothetical protein
MGSFNACRWQSAVFGRMMSSGGQPLARWAAVLLIACCGCSGHTRPRTRDDIFQDRLKVDTLYLTEDGQRIVKPLTPERAIVIDATANKLAWPAWQCNNPKCPGRAADGAPFVFPWPDPFALVKPDGTIGIRQPETAEDQKKMEDFGEQKCPKCKAVRTLAEETPEQRQQYKDWCQPHVLPQAAKQLAALDAELKQLVQREQERQANRRGND